MKDPTIIKNYEPFPFLEIENVYNEFDLKLIWKELEFLNHPTKLKGPEDTGSAFHEGKVLKNNKGIYLDNLYQDRGISDILNVSSKLFDPIILKEFSSLCFMYENIKHTNYDTTLLSYYENGGYYKPHQDNALYTGITWFFKEPKKFTGGDFYFTDHNLKIEIKNNKTVLFPSIITHHVDEIVMKENSDYGYGRYSIVQFLYLIFDKNP